MVERKRILLCWAEDHNVWRGYFSYFDEIGDLQILFWVIKSTDVRTKRRPIFKELRGRIFVKGLSQVIDDFKPDVIVVLHIFEPTSWHAMFHAIKKKIPIIILEAIHIYPLEWTRKPRKFKPFLFKLLVPIVGLVYNTYLRRRKVQLLCITRRSQRFMERLGFKDVEYALQPYAFFYSGRSALRPSQHRHQGFRLLYVGRFTEMKNLFFVLDLLKDFKIEGRISAPNFTFTMVGGGGEEDSSIKRYVEENGLDDIVKIVGQQPHETLEAYYRSSDLFVLASYDVLGAVALEALENRLPILIADKSGFSSLMEIYQDRLIFEQNNKQNLREKLLWCIRNKRGLPAMGARLYADLQKEECEGKEKLKALINKAA
jgi:glycosyltransferase involved in cell wall biosynthesis